MDFSVNGSGMGTEVVLEQDVARVVRAEVYGEAPVSVIEVIREDRVYDDEGARRACIAIFKMLGDEHPLTGKYRREFSMALY